jgi:xanthine dehydrogenase accessory factor
LVRGGGELSSACARLLFLAGFPVVVLERAEPLAVRRLVAFAEAVLNGECSVEGVTGRLVVDAVAPAAGLVAVTIDPEGRLIETLAPVAIVDGRMAKHGRAGREAIDRPRGSSERTPRGPVTVGLGPGFIAGEDVDAVVETQRGPDLGRVLWSGSAQPDTAAPAPVLGIGEARVLRAPRAGRFEARARIGDVVDRGVTVGTVGGEAVVTGTAGLLRGLLASGIAVEAGTKLGDVDPRGAIVDPSRVSDKARAVAAGALEAICLGLTRNSPAPADGAPLSPLAGRGTG